jgi:hypothetical protein
MGYMHIENLYKNKKILLFKKCYATEKIDGTSAHIGYNRDLDKLDTFAGTQSFQFYEQYKTDIWKEKLKKFCLTHQTNKITIYGEWYGGGIQGNRFYGEDKKFIAFDVKIDDYWINVKNASLVATSLGLDFVPFEIVDTDETSLINVRSKPSEIAKKAGFDHIREGVVLHPLEEVRLNDNSRIMCKYKNDDFSEIKHEPKPFDPEQAKILEKANEIVEQFVTYNRLKHVIQTVPLHSNDDFGAIIRAMAEDVKREGDGEFVDFNKQVVKLIGKKTIELIKSNYEELIKLSGNE